MQVILKHIREQTIPHDFLEELFDSKVAFYDGMSWIGEIYSELMADVAGCLIVQIQDHRSGAAAPPKESSNLVGGTNTKPFSIHNYNEHITPSPFVPYPKGSVEAQDVAASAQDAAANGPGEAVDGPKRSNTENVIAQGQTSAKEVVKGPKIITTVLFDTQLSQYEHLAIMARMPLPDSRNNQRKQLQGAAGKDGATPTMAHPPTPLASVPSTPMVSRGQLPKRQKMMVDGSNVHEVQAEIMLKEDNPLLLQPARDLEEAQAIIAALEHPLHQNRPPAPKTRKRTTAELAADEAQAAAEERFMLICDERLAPSSSAGGGGVGSSGVEGQGGAASFEPRFSRFKTLENIKMHHEEKERLKKEEEYMMKKQTDAEAAKRKEFEERQRVIMQQRQQQQQAYLQQQQLHAQQLQQAQQQNGMLGAHPQQAAAAIANQQHHQHQQAPQAQHASPVVRQQTPAASSPGMNATSMPTPSMASVPMAVTTSTQGAGSPPRPPSAIPHHPGSVGPTTMARQLSQQHGQQVASANGTPQMMQRTPSMAQTTPVTRNLTPQPRMNQHGSPVGGQQMQGTPMMGPTPQMNGQHLTPQQIAIMQRQAQMRAAQQQAAMQGSPPQMSLEHSQQQQQIALMQARAAQQQQQQLAQFHAQQQGNSNGGNNMAYNQQMVRQAQAAMNSVQSGNRMPAGSPGQVNPVTLQIRRLQQQHNQDMTQLAMRHGGNVPQQIQQQLTQRYQQQIQQVQQAQQNAQAQAQAQAQMQQAQLQHRGGQNLTVQQQQYMATLQAQQRMLAAGRNQAMSGMQGMNMGNMGNLQMMQQAQQQGMGMGSMQMGQGMQGIGSGQAMGGGQGRGMG